jgi:glycosyltransferase involved in cell wall biosynthesis
MSDLNKNRHNVLYISSWYPNRNNPTHGIFVKRHAEATALFHNISVIHVCSCLNLKSIYETEITEENNVFSVVVYYKKVLFPIPGISHIMKMFRYIKAHFIAYQSIIEKKGKPELIHLNIIYKAGLIALIFNRLYQTPFIISEHWSGYMPEDGSYKGFLKKLITSRAVRRASAVLVISEKMKENMLRHKLNNKYYKIPNVVDIKLFKPRENRNDKSGTINMLHVSSLNDREKNISGILKAISLLSKISSNFRLDILGDSEEKQEFEKLAEKLGILNKHVFFHGHKNPKETADFMRNADFFLMFSNYEGLPCVLIEALASGIPVVATHTGGIPEHIDYGQGMLVKTNDVEKLVKTLQEMIDKHTDFSPSELSRYAAENFSYQQVGRQISNIYQKTILNKGE